MNTKAVAAALDVLGSAWRGDWSDFDGRTLRYQLEDLSAALRSDVPFDTDRYLRGIGACPECACWFEHCHHTD